MSRWQRLLVYGFIAMGVLASGLNSAAAVLNFREGAWSLGAGYAFIAVALTLFTFLGWYSAVRQKPYRWRPEEGDAGRKGDRDSEEP